MWGRYGRQAYQAPMSEHYPQTSLLHPFTCLGSGRLHAMLLYELSSSMDAEDQTSLVGFPENEGFVAGRLAADHRLSPSHVLFVEASRAKHNDTPSRACVTIDFVT
jgi:hypothetical protein